ncbi:hypothetical protein DY000_02055327 [Brassica cretica]|uniref:argininosuccinate synthase n=1 Tax=Brassica cretica TaxID=69181 RepID=A0ABQ7AAX6_BRACR|nr:hypothetical protein DY000_02055327 [Brassica cretica]
MYMMSVDPENAPDQPEYIEIGIESGLPVALNGKSLSLSPATLLSELNTKGGKHGIGRIWTWSCISRPNKSCNNPTLRLREKLEALSCKENLESERERGPHE